MSTKKNESRYATDGARTGTTRNCTSSLDGRTIHATGVCATPTALDVRPCVDTLERVLEAGDRAFSKGRIIAGDIAAHSTCASRGGDCVRGGSYKLSCQKDW